MRLTAADPNWPGVLSHPAENGRSAMPLERHLLGVGDRARTVTPETARAADGGSLRAAAEAIGVVHDFGKATDWFQTHIGNGTDDDGPTHHARLGGLLAYYTLRSLGYGPRTRYAGLVAVAKHHGTLPDYDWFLETQVDNEETWGGSDSGFNGDAIRQAKQIDTARPEFARAVIGHVLGDAGSWAEFRDLLVASAPNGRQGTSTDGSDETLRELIRDDFFHVARRARLNTSLGDEAAYLDAVRLFGALTFADKTHAAGVGSDDDRLYADPLDPAQVRAHIDDLGGDVPPDSLQAGLNAVRGAVQTRIAGTDDVDPIDEFVHGDADVATLTLPTGYGKTLSGLLAAARIREMTDGERIVYALPFTSVVDQTADVLRDILGDADGTGDSDGRGDPSLGRQLTVHHHLTEALTLPSRNGDPVEEETDGDSDRAVMLAESWRSGVTLSTFVQLFETLAGPDNGQSMKLPALYGSVVVIDEPQALPLTWWPLVEELIDALVTDFDATVVMMTATQPRLLDDERTYSLVERSELDAIEGEQFSTPLDRVEYEFHPTALQTDAGADTTLEYEEAAAELVSAVTAGGSTLAVCNTIDSSAELFDEVTDRLEDSPPTGMVDIAASYEERVLRPDQFGVPDGSVGDRLRDEFVQDVTARADQDSPAALYLSTRLRPCDRRFLLGVASKLTEAGVPLLVVSTQLVEAGVDVSFDRVYRDFAPLDSIVQAAGRCNRSFERYPDTGTVVVWRLGPPEGSDKIPGEIVYARRDRDTELDLLAKTREALSEVPTDTPVPARRLDRVGVERYHDAVGDAVSTVAPDNALRSYFEKAKGSKLNAASLIESRLSFDVYVCRSDRDEQRVEAFRAAERDFEFDEASNIRQELADIRVSIPVYSRRSDATERLIELEPLSDRAEHRDATERVLTVDSFGDESFFDERTGVMIPDSDAGRRIL